MSPFDFPETALEATFKRARLAIRQAALEEAAEVAANLLFNSELKPTPNQMKAAILALVDFPDQKVGDV